jgi:hypothetical protein
MSSIDLRSPTAQNDAMSSIGLRSPAAAKGCDLKHWFALAGCRKPRSIFPPAESLWRFVCYRRHAVIGERRV